MNKHREKRKAVPAILGFLVLIAAAVVVTQIIEVKSQKEIVETRAAYTVSEDQTTLDLFDTEYTYDHKIETYLFLGTDISGNEEGEGEDYTGSMADFLGLLVVDMTEQTYALLHLNRDTITEMPLIDWQGEGEATAEQQLCMAHWYGGTKEMSCENTVNTVSDMLGGLPINGYYALSMKNLTDLNSAVGGVTLTVQDDLTEADPELKKGATVTLTDKQVEIYTRGRHGIGDGENLGRMDRQEQFLTAFADKLKTTAAGSGSFALNVFHKLEQLAVSDINGKTISRLANKLPGYTDKGVFVFEGTTEIAPGAADHIDHMQFYPDEKSVVDIMTELFSLQINQEE